MTLLVSSYKFFNEANEFFGGDFFKFFKVFNFGLLINTLGLMIVITTMNHNGFFVDVFLLNHFVNEIIYHENELYMPSSKRIPHPYLTLLGRS